MANLFAWIIAAAAPVAKKVLISLGIGWVSFTGVTLIITQVQNSIISQWGLVSVSISNILTIAGFPESMGILLGAMAARGALMAASHLGRIT